VVLQVAPYALVRVAGLQIDAVSQVNRPTLLASISDSLDDLTDRLGHERNSLCQRLFRLVGDSGDIVRRRALVALKRAVFNNRLPASGLPIDALRSALPDDDDLWEDLRKWWARLACLVRMEREGDQVAAEELVRVNRMLLGHWSDEMIRNGVMFAQPHFFDQVESECQSKQQVLSRRSKATLAAYCYRAATKTSPFGAFTTTTVRRVEPNGKVLAQNEPVAPCESVFTLNASVIEALSSAIGAHSDIGPHLPLRLNDTIEVRANEVIFLLQAHASLRDEWLASIETTPIVDFVVKSVGGHPGTLSLAQLLDTLSVAISEAAIRDRLTEAINHLVEIGLLQCSLEYDANSPSALAQLAETPVLARSDIGRTVQDLLRQIASAIDALHAASSLERRRLLITVRDGVNSALNVLQDDASKIREQGLVHHNVYCNSDNDEYQLDTLLPALGAIQGILPLYNADLPYRHIVQRFAASEVSRSQGGISIIELFQRFAAAPLTTDGTVLDGLKKQQKELALHLQKEAISSEVDEVELSWGRFQAFSVSAQPYRPVTAIMSVAYLGQLFNEPLFGQRFVVNQVLPGYGQVFARAAAESGDRQWLAAEIVKCRQSLAIDADVVDVLGTYGFDGQLHPALEALRLAVPGETIRQQQGRQLTWSEVHARRDGNRGCIRLTDRISGRWLLPVMSGTLSPSLLPQFCRFVLSFGPAFFPHFPVLELIDDAIPPNSLGGIDYYARLRLGPVILLRRTWRIPRSCIPASADGSTAFGDFRRLRSWAMHIGLPRCVFVTAATSSRLPPLRVASAPRLRKPFFVNWDDINSHLQFRRFTRAAAESIIVSEMLPMPEQTNAQFGRSNRVREHLIELSGCL